MKREWDLGKEKAREKLLEWALLRDFKYRMSNIQLAVVCHW